MIAHMFQYLPFTVYEAKFMLLIQVVLAKLQESSWNIALKKRFVICMSVFEMRQFEMRQCRDETIRQVDTPGRLHGVLESIRAGLFEETFEHLWLPTIEYFTTKTERKLAAVGLAKLM